ncbi:MAG TPA: cupin domain-containing protein [Terriglobales bacterium]|nr:cupin domain-containing protein [Terriglobales bacterium]
MCQTTAMEKVNIAERFDRFSQRWQPKIAGELNDSYVKLVKLEGEFVWHKHDAEDELFLVVKGTLRMKVRRTSAAQENATTREEEFVINPGEFLIVPRGTEHLPIADEEVHVVLLEPKSTLNTGDVRNERTVEQLEWV